MKLHSSFLIVIFSMMLYGTSRAQDETQPIVEETKPLQEWRMGAQIMAADILRQSVDAYGRSYEVFVLMDRAFPQSRFSVETGVGIASSTVDVAIGYQGVQLHREEVITTERYVSLMVPLRAKVRLKPEFAAYAGGLFSNTLDAKVGKTNFESFTSYPQITISALAGFDTHLFSEDIVASAEIRYTLTDLTNGAAIGSTHREAHPLSIALGLGYMFRR